MPSSHDVKHQTHTDPPWRCRRCLAVASGEIDLALDQKEEDAWVLPWLMNVTCQVGTANFRREMGDRGCTAKQAPVHD